MEIWGAFVVISTASMFALVLILGFFDSISCGNVKHGFIMNVWKSTQVILRSAIWKASDLPAGASRSWAMRTCFFMILLGQFVIFTAYR